VVHLLLHHVHALPYRDRRGNVAGSASAAALVVVATINLLRAGFEAAEYVPRGPNAYLMNDSLSLSTRGCFSWV